MKKVLTEAKLILVFILLVPPSFLIGLGVEQLLKQRIQGLGALELIFVGILWLVFVGVVFGVKKWQKL